MTLITYAHSTDPTGVRFRQDSADQLPVWAVDVQLDLENYPLVERRITEMQADAYDQFRSFLTSDELIERMRAEYDRLLADYPEKAHLAKLLPQGSA